MRLIATPSLPAPPDDPLQLERSRRFQLARVLRVTEDMLEQANAGNWERVEELEAQRGLELEECFCMQDEEPSALIAEALATLIYLNEQLVQIVRYARERANVERFEHRRALKAASAYSDN